SQRDLGAPGARPRQLGSGEHTRPRRRADYALHLVDHVCGNVRKAVALDSHVEVPRRAAERLTLHSLLDGMHAWDLDGGPAAGDVEVAKKLALSHELAHEDRRDLVPTRHHLHGERPAPHDVAEIVEAGRADEPRLVGEYMKAGVVQLTHGRHL